VFCRVLAHARKRRLAFGTFRHHALQPERIGRREFTDDVLRRRLVEPPMAVQQHVDFGADCFARRKGAGYAVGYALPDLGIVDCIGCHAVERRDLDRGIPFGGDCAGAVRIALERAVADAAVDVGVDAHFFAQLPAEQRVHRHAGGLRAYVHDRHFERAQHRVGREAPERVWIDGQQRQRLLEGLADQLRQQPVETRELHCFPALQRGFAQTGQACVGGKPEERPVRFRRDVDEQRFYFCDFHFGRPVPARRVRTAHGPRFFPRAPCAPYGYFNRESSSAA